MTLPTNERSRLVLSLLRSLLLLVMSLVFSGVGSSSVAVLRDVLCCSAQPSWDTAVMVTCNCTNRNTVITLENGHIPKSVRNISIVDTLQVIVDKDAISGLHSLSSFSVLNTDKLQINREGMALQNNSGPLIVTFKNISTLQVNSNAVSGVWTADMTITMHQIKNISIESNAFEFHFAGIGPKVILGDVDMLNVKPYGIVSIFNLEMVNVAMEVCEMNAFGGNVSYIDWINVTIYEAKCKCFNGWNKDTLFHIDSLILRGKAYAEAFSGTLSEINIQNSRFNTLDKRCFHICADKFFVTESNVKEILPYGFTVFAKQKIHIHNLVVDELRKNALFGLQIEHNEESHGILISHLNITEADNGSLTFSECTKVHLTDLNLMAPWPRICPTEKWTQALSGGGVSGQLTPAQYQIFSNLLLTSNCEEANMTIPTSVDKRDCSLQTGKTSVCKQLDIRCSSGDGAASRTTVTVPAGYFPATTINKNEGHKTGVVNLVEVTTTTTTTVKLTTTPISPHSTSRAPICENECNVPDGWKAALGCLSIILAISFLFNVYLLYLQKKQKTKYSPANSYEMGLYLD